jgi:hypothetical protein
MAKIPKVTNTPFGRFYFCVFGQHSPVHIDFSNLFFSVGGSENVVRKGESFFPFFLPDIFTSIMIASYTKV